MMYASRYQNLIKIWCWAQLNRKETLRYLLPCILKEKIIQTFIIRFVLQSRSFNHTQQAVTQWCVTQLLGEASKEETPALGTSERSRRARKARWQTPVVFVHVCISLSSPCASENKECWNWSYGVNPAFPKSHSGKSNFCSSADYHAYSDL